MYCIRNCCPNLPDTLLKAPHYLLCLFLLWSLDLLCYPKPGRLFVPYICWEITNWPSICYNYPQFNMSVTAMWNDWLHTAGCLCIHVRAYSCVCARDKMCPCALFQALILRGPRVTGNPGGGISHSHKWHFNSVSLKSKQGDIDFPRRGARK